MGAMHGATKHRLLEISETVGTDRLLTSNNARLVLEANPDG